MSCHRKHRHEHGVLGALRSYVWVVVGGGGGGEGAGGVKCGVGAAAATPAAMSLALRHRFKRRLEGLYLGYSGRFGSENQFEFVLVLSFLRGHHVVPLL